MSKAHQEAVERYNAKNYTRLTVRLKNEDVDRIKAAIGPRSVNGFVVEAIEEKIEREAKTQEIERVPYFD